MRKILKLSFYIIIALVYSNYIYAAWDLSTASYDNVSTTLHSSFYDEYFTSDGLSLYTINFSSKVVNQYSLSSAWDLSTISFVRSFSTTSQGSPQSLSFKPDGTKMFIIEFYGDSLREYSLSTPWIISSASYVGVFGFTSSIGDSLPYGGTFSNDGSKYYLIDSYDRAIYQYSLSTPWTISSMTYSNKYFSCSSVCIYGDDLMFSDDGTQMVLIRDDAYNNTINEVRQYNLSTAWDISTAADASKTINLTSITTSPESVFVKPDSSKMYVGAFGGGFYQFSLADTVAPRITSVSSSKSNGTYTVGEIIDIDVTFSEPVTSTGNVIVTIETGDIDRTCEFSVSNSSSGTCNYTVQTGDTSSDLDVSISGTLDDASGNDLINFAPLTTFAENKNIIIDTRLSAISNVSGSADNNSLTISWETDELTSYTIDYGTNSNYDLRFSSDTNALTHSVTLTGLISCTRYFYRINAIDTGTNNTQSSGYSTATTGCALSGMVNGSLEVISSAGGSVSHTHSNSTVAITAPNDWYSSSLTIQINLLDEDSLTTSPEGKLLLDGNIYNFVAIDESGNEIIAFDEDLTIVLSYDETTETTFEETTLDLYKYDSGTWVKKNCLVDINANTLTCSLSGFSTYGIFGEGLSEDPTSPSEPADSDVENVVENTLENTVLPSLTSKTFHKDKRCHYKKPAPTTWITLTPTIRDSVNGIMLNWTQYDANKVTIMIDDGTGSFPWKISKTVNDGHQFLENVETWQKIKIKPYNHCAKGNESSAVSHSAYPNGWYNFSLLNF